MYRPSSRSCFGLFRGDDRLPSRRSVPVGCRRLGRDDFARGHDPGARYRGFWLIQLVDGELRDVTQQRKACVVQVARLGIENAERTDTAAVAEDQRMTGIEANSRVPGNIGVVGEPLVHESIADNERFALEYRVTAK